MSRLTLARWITTKGTALPALERELILAHVLKKPREFIIAHPDQPLTLWQFVRAWHLAAQRTHGVPLAYLTGHKSFYGLEFSVSRHTLIPRPETEILVEEVIAYIDELPTTQELILIDVGTGSGCVPVAIHSVLRKRNRNRVTYRATDISRRALAVARHNAKKNGVPIIFNHGHLLEGIVSDAPNKGCIIITANLPYLSQTEYQKEASIQYEPRQALVAPNEGLGLYHDLIRQIASWMQKNGHPETLFVALEINPGQAEALSTFAVQNLPRVRFEIKKDLAGRDRVLLLSYR